MYLSPVGHCYRKLTPLDHWLALNHPSKWGDGTHSQFPSRMGPAEPPVPGDGTGCWEYVLAEQEQLGMGL